MSKPTTKTAKKVATQVKNLEKKVSQMPDKKALMKEIKKIKGTVGGLV